MRDDKITTEIKLELNDIYQAHDVDKFREFLAKHADRAPTFLQLKDLPDEALSELLYQAKAQLVYLGEAYYAARNWLRHKKFDYCGPIESYPKCAQCQHFRSEQLPCMHDGAAPSDIACREFKAIRQN